MRCILLFSRICHRSDYHSFIHLAKRSLCTGGMREGGCDWISDIQEGVSIFSTLSDKRREGLEKQNEYMEFISF